MSNCNINCQLTVTDKIGCKTNVFCEIDFNNPTVIYTDYPVDSFSELIRLETGSFCDIVIMNVYATKISHFLTHYRKISIVPFKKLIQI